MIAKCKAVTSMLYDECLHILAILWTITIDSAFYSVKFGHYQPPQTLLLVYYFVLILWKIYILHLKLIDLFRQAQRGTFHTTLPELTNTGRI